MLRLSLSSIAIASVIVTSSFTLTACDGGEGEGEGEGEEGEGEGEEGEGEAPIASPCTENTECASGICLPLFDSGPQADPNSPLNAFCTESCNNDAACDFSDAGGAGGRCLQVGATQTAFSGRAALRAPSRSLSTHSRSPRSGSR